MEKCFIFLVNYPISPHIRPYRANLRVSCDFAIEERQKKTVAQEQERLPALRHRTEPHFGRSRDSQKKIPCVCVCVCVLVKSARGPIPLSFVSFCFAFVPFCFLVFLLCVRCVVYTILFFLLLHTKQEWPAVWERHKVLGDRTIFFPNDTRLHPPACILRNGYSIGEREKKTPSIA